MALDPQLTAKMHATMRQVAVSNSRSGQLKDTNIGVWHAIDTRRKWVSLTFDDGPSTKTTLLLNALRSVHAKATFFIVGSRAEAVPDQVRRMATDGHEVENHSYTHPNIAQCLPTTVEGEILKTNVIIRSLTGRYPLFFRPPGGNANRTLSHLADAFGLRLAFWSVDALKAEETASEPGLISYVLKKVHPGAIVLMHNGPDVTTAAVPKLVTALRARGYRIVTLKELMGK